MKRKNLKNLSLNKILISEIGQRKIKGGLVWGDNKFTDTCPTSPTRGATCNDSCGATCP